MINIITNIIIRAVNEPEPKVTIPEDISFGHYTTNLAMTRAKLKETNPKEEAREIISAILKESPKNFFDKIEIAGPGFINFFISPVTIEKEIKKILNKKERYGSSSDGKGKAIVIDYSAPNIAKPMSIGHLRSTVIGASLVNLLKFQGYKVIGDNHLGDWGTQFGTLIYAYKNWGNKNDFNQSPIEYLVSLYIRFNQEVLNKPELMDEARNETTKLQKGDKRNMVLWRLFVKESLKEFNKIYKRLEVKFDVSLGESFYQPMLSQIVQDALIACVAKREDGAVKIFFNDEKLPPYVIEKSDGSHLYTTTDLATIKYRVKKWKPVKILYVVANEQSLHFAQLFEAAKTLSFVPSTELIHVKFGMMLGESGKKFSTRKGDFIKLSDLLDKVKAEAVKINAGSAEEVGVGAIKYYDLSHYRLNDIVFDWNAALNLKGNSAPYIQYTYARLKNINIKAKSIKPVLNLSLLTNDAEKKVIDALIHFSDVLNYSANKLEPNHLADYLFKTANLLNAFYETSSIIKADKEIASSRLALANAGAIILKNGLDLLNIKLPKKM